MAKEKAKQGVYYHPKYGRVMEHEGRSMHIFWNQDMLGFLRRHFATTLNNELAECLGVSPRTVVRKARELGLEKDPVWLAGIWDERRIMANAKVRRTGNGGQFVKGERRHPSTEFKPGHQMTPEQRQRQRDGLRVWALRHPQKVKERAIKIWETRRRNMVSNSNL